METKTKNRGWVKNAAIIFLSVMLVLTFFSNTFMNRSLPEVATKNIGSGTITARIRGTGTVSANQNYDVIIDQTRKVKTVNVRVGDEVKAGDVLFVLADTESAELEAAQESLQQLNMSYQRALINAADTDYARENRDIQRARDTLQEAEQKRDELAVTDLQLGQAKEYVEDMKADVAYAERRLEKAQAELDEIAPLIMPDDETLQALRDSMNEAKEKINDAENALATAKLIYGGKYDELVAEATKQICETPEYLALSTENAQRRYIEEMLPVYIPYVINQLKENDSSSSSSGVIGGAGGGTSYVNNEYETAFNEITSCEDDLKALEKQYNALRQQYSNALAKDNSELYNEYSDDVKKAQSILKAAQEAQTEAENELSRLQSRKEEYEAAVNTVKSCQSTLEDLLFSLQQQQAADKKTQQLENLDLQDLANQISKAKERVAELTEDTLDKEIKADVAGTIQTISVTAGNMTTAGSPMATIEIPDMGYTMSFSVTNEQARRVHVGDTATVSNYYWGSQIDAVLTGIKTDPQNPQMNKLLIFEVSGDVSVGANLTISIGQKSSEYDYVVPNSALRSDSNGDFIYVITAKNSALGNRYYATRVEITKLANDDTNTAIVGDLNFGDFVITTSTKPLNNGDLVRMPD